jgi:transcriptional regulator with XRE-family HTH domain
MSSEKLRKLCAERQLRVSGLLREAGVSRTAYYSLARKESVLPKSVERIAAHLKVAPAAFLEDDGAVIQHVRALQAQAEAVHRTNRKLDRDVIYRTLENLELTPIERLRRALTRGQSSHLHR